jgi:hypothetical protein
MGSQAAVPPARTVSPVVVQPIGRDPQLGQPAVLGETPRLAIAAIHPPVPVGHAVVLGSPGDFGDPAGMTSEPQAGHQYTPSGRRRISGWPHSQA